MVSRGEPRLLRARPRRRGDTWYKTGPSGPLQTAAQDRSCHPSARSLKFILNSPPTSLDHCSGLPTLDGAARKSFQNINQMVTAWFSALPAMTPCCAWCGRRPSPPLRSPGHLLPPSPLTRPHCSAQLRLPASGSQLHGSTFFKHAIRSAGWAFAPRSARGKHSA